MPKIADDLSNVIETFVEQEALNLWYDYFEKNYSLPRSVVQNKLRKILANSYQYQKGLFKHSLQLKGAIVSFAKCLFVLMIAVFCSRTKKPNRPSYKLLLDGVQSRNDEWAKKEVMIFEKLIGLFGSENVLIASLNNISMDGLNIIYRPYHRFYLRIIALKTFISEITKGLWVHGITTFKTKVNFFIIAREIINNYLYYASLFEQYQIKDVIQLRHYQTNPIKDHLLHQYGGRYSSCIQKNIYQIGSNGLYYHADIFFSLGNKTVLQAFDYGARIAKVVPVGSLAMEASWFKRPKKEIIQEFDIVYLGINLGLFYMDSYDEFCDDYYSSFKWLVRFKKENSELKVAIKHHPGNTSDPVEMDIIKNSGIERVHKLENSYAIAFSSKCVVAFGSTMVYEMAAHGVPSFFMDAGGRGALLPPLEKDFFRTNRTTSYEEFSEKVKNVLKENGTSSRMNTHKDYLCLQSDAVSDRIFSFFNEDQS